ncbi:hypothetical protein CGCSCA5_v001902 [Colletotrichum siamense]|nr:hypothetical protein CGCSCA5_v001902 [Colletotrichum siamense]
MDTAGFLARDPSLMDAKSKALYKNNYTSYDDGSLEYPKTLYVLDFPTTTSASSQRILKFSQDLALAACLNTVVTAMSLKNALEATTPATRLFRDPFYRDCAAVHDGRLPFVDHVPPIRWACGDAQPDSYYNDAVHNKTVLTEWFNSKVLPPASDISTCTSASLLHTDSTGYFSTRNC